MTRLFSQAARPYLALTAAMALWGGSFIAMKVAVSVYHPLVVVFSRMLLGSLLFATFFRRAHSVQYQRGDWRLMAFMVICEPFFYFLFESFGLQLTTASQASMVTATLPLLVALAAAVALKERAAPKTWLGFVLAVAGVVWLSSSGEATETAPHPLLGNFMEFMAMVCAAGYTITLKKLSTRYSPFFLTAVQAHAGALLFLPGLFLPWTSWPSSFTWGPVLAILYLGVFVTIAAYACYNYGISRIPANRAGAFVNLIPVFSVIQGYLFLGERFTAPQCAASALVFVGVFLSQGRSERNNAGQRV
jgi:drug/metabolite transporter (DMT)-like permease